jgi:hypothetical protein
MVLKWMKPIKRYHYILNEWNKAHCFNKTKLFYSIGGSTLFCLFFFLWKYGVTVEIKY